MKPGDLAVWRRVIWKRGHPIQLNPVVRIVKMGRKIAKVQMRVPEESQPRLGLWFESIRDAYIGDLTSITQGDSHVRH